MIPFGYFVLMRPSDTSKPAMARVEMIEQDNKNNVRVLVRWYYRPEESTGGRKEFHGAKEVFSSDHCDFQSADTIEGFSTTLLLGISHLTVLLCTANVICLITRISSWCSVRVARIGTILHVWA